MSAADPRPAAERRRHAEERLAAEADLWVATAMPDGVPYLVPLSYHWDGRTLVLATNASSPTARNLARTGRVRATLDGTRDVVLVEGSVDTLPMPDLDTERADRFAAHAGFDPRTLATAYRWFVVTPTLVQAWREENELAGRDLMRDGRWLVPATAVEHHPDNPTKDDDA